LAIKYIRGVKFSPSKYIKGEYIGPPFMSERRIRWRGDTNINPSPE
jgi:hypothetical protein